MNFILSLFFISITFFSHISYASFDVRHEYKVDRAEHQNRAKAGYKFENELSIDVELKFRSEDPSDIMEDLEVYAKELSFGYHYKLDKEWTLSPGMPVETSSGDETYKPQLRLTYKPESLPDWSFSGRYRMDIKPHEGIKKKRHRLTFVTSIKGENWNWSYEGNVYAADNSNYHLFKNKRTNYEQNLKFNYKHHAWSPYIELGDISISSSSSERELRFRMGLRFAFNIYEWDKVNSHLD